MKEIRKNILTAADIAYLIDASTLKLDTSYEDVTKLIEACKKYHFGCAFAWPAYYELLRKELKGTQTAFGTSLSFPSGQETTFIKVTQAHYFESLGAAEVDMVMNVGWLKSKRYNEVLDDIKAVRYACKSSSLKVIIEAMLLTDEEIGDACRIVIDAGADYVKSGTGFSANPTTIHHVEVMKKAIGDTIKLKVAGGVRDLQTLVGMYKKGADRFGIGLAASINIMEEALALPEAIDVSTFS
ncbi:MAG: deoxyribose-phosphate aldolase [Prevotellaceae bacterium]|jgi:deoxyribose-phosphate aldolase|nr:deoxyribose-phosphate aldolase [Prevotellaceae bacterium]